MGQLVLASRALLIGFFLLGAISITACASMNVDRPRPACAALNTAKDHYRCAMEHYHDGNYTAATAEFSEAIALDPRYDDAFAMRGVSNRHSGNLQAAIADLEEAIRLRPNDSSHYNNRGNANLEAGNYDAALYDFGRAVELDRTFPDAFYNRATLYLELRDPKRALPDFGSAIEFYGAAAEGNIGTLGAWFNTEFYYHEIRPNGLRRIDQYLADTYFYRGRVHKQLGDEERAQSDFASARKIDPAVDERFADVTE